MGGVKAGAGADPYIITISGELYKMTNFEGASRMIQGLFKNKLLTINAYTRYSTDIEKKETHNIISKKVQDLELKDSKIVSNFKNYDYKDYDNTYISKLFIKWGDEYIIIDVDNLDIIENNSNFKISNKKIQNNNNKTFLSKNNNDFPFYNNLEEDYFIIKLDEIQIIISYSDIPQIRGSFYIENNHLITNPIGAIVSKLYYKDIKLKNIKSIKPIKFINRTIPKKRLKEIYLDNDGIEYNKIIDIF